jgi:hypothetical protein
MQSNQAISFSFSIGYPPRFQSDNAADAAIGDESAQLQQRLLPGACLDLLKRFLRLVVKNNHPALLFNQIRNTARKKGN